MGIYSENDICKIENKICSATFIDGGELTGARVGEACGTDGYYEKFEALISEGVTSIGYKAFSDCLLLEKIKIPKSVIKIGVMAFDYCKALTTLELSEGLLTIGDFAFSGCINLLEANIPASVTEIGSFAFANCSALSSITVAEGNGAYKSMDGNLYTADGKTLIQYAIGKTEKSFSVPQGVEEIAKSAFYGSKSLEEIKIPGSVSVIGEQAFANCPKLASISVEENNQSYKSIEGCLYTGDGAILLHYPIGKEDKEVILPTCVTAIGKHAFSGCEKIEKIEIPDGLVSIGESAFYSCKGLASVSIPKSVISIGYWAFFGCNLKFVIYCEAEEKPKEWNKKWNPMNRPVHWGRKQ